MVFRNPELIRLAIPGGEGEVHRRGCRLTSHSTPCEADIIADKSNG